MKSRVTVGMKWDKNAIYCGRGTILGNPNNPTGKTDLKNMTDSERDEVCDAFEEQFPQRMRHDIEFRTAVTELVVKAETNHIVLGCFCAPKRCHLDIIKKYIDNQLKDKK